MFEFLIFGLLLFGLAIFHDRTLEVAALGTLALVVYKVVSTDLDLQLHLARESHLLVNLFCLLLGFAILSKHFEESGLPEWLTSRLPEGWLAGFCLLAIVAGISVFLDNIAGAIIGGVMARRMYGKRVTLSFIVALVAASNAAGAGSVIGDTTTTMMWIAGVPAITFLKAFLGAGTAIVFSGIIASRHQQTFQPFMRRKAITSVDRARLFIVGIIILGTIAANVGVDFPAVGLWAGIFVGAFIRSTPWRELQRAYKGNLFLILLVLSASFMPVQALPPATWQSALGLGFVSAIFDNIPLTALAIYQGGYDWGVLAYTVGYGGSLIWFGSSAGVAITSVFPQAKKTLPWIIDGWHAYAGYVLGFFVMLAATGWNP